MAVPEHSVHYLEFVTPDVEGVRSLCETCYGWHFKPIVQELGDAFVAELPDGSLCGVRAPMSPEEKPIARSYVRVSDVEASVKCAADAGATIMLERMELPGYGVIAVYLQGGIEHGIWQVP